MINLVEMDKKVEETLSPEKQQALKEMIEDFKPIVERIENSLATTQGHYGDYMALLSQTKSKNMTAYIS